MNPRVMLILVLAIVALFVLVTVGGARRGGGALSTEPPGWVEGLGGWVGARPVRFTDLGPATSCASPDLERALTGETNLNLGAGRCELDVPSVEGFLVRPRAVRSRVVGGAVEVVVVQRGRGDPLTLEDDFGRGDEVEASFGKRGGSVSFICSLSCTLAFTP